MGWGIVIKTTVKEGRYDEVGLSSKHNSNANTACQKRVCRVKIRNIGLMFPLFTTKCSHRMSLSIPLLYLSIVFQCKHNRQTSLNIALMSLQSLVLDSILKTHHTCIYDGI